MHIRPDENADYYTCLNDCCPAYNKTFRSDEAEHYGCDDCRSENLDDFQHVKQRALTGVDAVSELGSFGVVVEENTAEPDERRSGD
jgi:hypothetical protein